MRQADGLFLSCARKMAEEYPDIKFEDQYLDTVCLRVSILLKLMFKLILKYIFDYLKFIRPLQ